jgi:hypothetical protein
MTHPAAAVRRGRCLDCPPAPRLGNTPRRIPPHKSAAGCDTSG